LFSRLGRDAPSSAVLTVIRTGWAANRRVAAATFAGVDWIAGLPTTEGGFDVIQNHVNLLSGKVHAVPTRATATAADAAEINRAPLHLII
jgi:hypothetical protein